MLIVQNPSHPNVAAPQVVSWAPSIRPIAYINVHLVRNIAGRRTLIHFEILDAKGARIPFDARDLPHGRPTEAQVDGFLSAPSVEGDTLDAGIARRLIPLVEICFGLSTFVGELPPAVLAVTRLDKARVGREALFQRQVERRARPNRVPHSL